jgi:predicted acylesterase/phospholipase RssA
MLMQSPTVALGLSHSLSHRLRAQTLLQPRRAPPQVIATVTAIPSAEEARLVLNLAAALADVGAGRVALVDPGIAPPIRSIAGATELEGITLVTGSTIDIAALRTDYALVLIRMAATDPQATAWIQEAEEVWALDIENNQATDWLRSIGEVKCWTAIRCAPSPAAGDDAAVVTLDPAVLSSAPIMRLEPQSGVAKSLRRFARRVLGRRLGLVLSAGGAKGFAHLGALRCLERAGLEFDLIAGASMGGVIGGLFAMGCGSSELVKNFEVLARHFRRLLLDFGFPEIALLRGEKKRALLRRQTGEVDIQDLPTPFWAVSADLASGREVVFGSGPLWQALDATSAIPAVFPPVVVGDRVLVDGWIVNPLPADVLRRAGADRIVAVDTYAQTEPLALFDEPSHGAGPRGWLKRLRCWLANPAIARIALRSLEVGARERTLANLALVDASVHPDVGAFSSTDFGSFTEIVERGERAAEAALPAIRQAISNKTTYG